MKNIFTIAPQAPFLETLAAGLWQRAHGDMFRLSDSLILLPTRRACRNLAAAFLRAADGKALLLPRLRPLGEGDEEERSFADDETANLPPVIAPLKRLMLLTRLVQRKDASLSPDQAALAAQALARFLDQAQIEQCDMTKLGGLVERLDLAQHWQETLRFLDIVTAEWPRILASEACLDPIERRNRVMAAQTEQWRQNPPAFPVIAAGSTGSVPATRDLLDVIAGLPLGAVILPGLDRAMDNQAWDEITATHPQFSMKSLLEKMGQRRETVQDWRKHSLSPRLKPSAKSMRPAAVTEAWRQLTPATIGREAISGLTRLDLDHPQDEARVIALCLGAALEDKKKRAALVTGDRDLALRVAAILRRWEIDIDDSAGAPLLSSPLGAFLHLLLMAAHPHAGAVDHLALLKHPLAACGMEAAQCRAEARKKTNGRYGGEERERKKGKGGKNSWN